MKLGLMSAYASIVAVNATRRSAGKRDTTAYQAARAPKVVRCDSTAKEEQPACDRKEW